ncbi:unnamed protein product, partial [Heterosigma akashiwo]
CPVGHYCPKGSSSPEPCPLGTFYDNEGNDGEIYYGNDSSWQTYCHLCQPKYACDETGMNSSYQHLCEAGYFCLLGANSTTPFCPTGGCDFGVCPAGHYCPAGTDHPKVCRNGTYNNFTGAAACTACPARYYCDSATPTTPQPCPRGYYCPKGTHVPEWCPKGTYGNTSLLRSSDECTDCGAGTYCGEVGSAEPTGPCTAGYYCPGEAACARCEAGTFNPSEGRDSCDPCPAGFYCPAGCVSPPREKLQHHNKPIALSGYYCPEGTEYAVQYQCPNGTFNNETMRHRIGDCIDAAAGWYADGAANAAPTGKCDVGFFCTGASPSATPWCDRSRHNWWDCGAGGPCEKGEECARGAHRPTPCRGGHYCAHPNGTVTGPCAAGYYCVGGSWDGTPEALYNANGTLLGDVCPAGHYCPEGSSQPVPCGPGHYASATHNTNASDCAPCTPGYHCPNASTVVPTELCPEGFYCEEGTENPHLQCAAGQQCPLGSSSAGDCPEGTYQPYAAQGNCSSCPPGQYCGVKTTTPSDCPPGFFCPESTRHAHEFPCPNGTYSNESRLEMQSQCVDCDPGSYCLYEGMTAPSGFCDSGFYCNYGAVISAPDSEGVYGYTGETCVNREDGQANDVCPVGHYCPQGSGYPIPCPQGTYNNESGAGSSSVCTDCTPGWYCDHNATIQPYRGCPSGYYCPGGDIVPTFLCPQGHYCPEKSGQPIQCNAGYYADDEGQASCTVCPAGYYCEDTAANITDCPAGHYCPNATEFATEFPCPAGTFNNRTNQQSLSDCQACTPGSYCLTAGLSWPTGPCDPGFYCPSGTATPTLTCQPGYFCPNGSATPTACPAGTFQSQDTKDYCNTCGEGYYCPEAASDELPCPTGHYCPQGTEYSTQFPCPNGTFSNATKLGQKSECTPCSPGSYCASQGLESPTGDCSEGYYCGAGSTTPTPDTNYVSYIGDTCSSHSGSAENDLCPPGHYCPLGSGAPTPCPNGTESNSTGLWTATQCQPCRSGNCDSCLDGHFCQSGSANLTACPRGYYCPSGTEYGGQHPCPQGTYGNRTALAAAADCAPCLPGSYCATEGLQEPTGLCAEGYYCGSGSKTPTPDSNATSYQGNTCTRRDGSAVNDVCPIGHYCPEGSTSPTPCEPGTYSNTTHLTLASECQECDAGFYCEYSGQTEPYQLCEQGYYCPGGDAVPTLNCSTGHYCPEGSDQPVPCSAGEYQDEKGQSVCKVCPHGYYCDGATVHPVDCPSGHYCPAGTEGATDYPCDLGTYNNMTRLRAANECFACLPGYHCSQEGLVTPVGLCDEGYYCHYCPQGSSSPQPCATGTMSAAELLASQDECANCTAGYYCYFCEAGTETPGSCPIGHYCPGGVEFSTEYPCPVGTFSNSTRLRNASECTACSGGFYCETEGLSEPTAECDPGYYCGSGSDTPTPDGTYGSYIGDTCIDRTNGSTNDVCPVGHYCPQGSSAPIRCPNGTMSNSTGLSAEAECQDCQAGYYCDEHGTVEAYKKCWSTYYCPSGTDIPSLACWEGHFCPNGSALPTICSAGTYQDQPQQSQCKSCPAGYYCLEGSANLTACPTGHFCPEGTEYATQYPCPNGTYSNTTMLEEVGDCTACTPGSYCGTEGLSAPTGECAAGYYCGGGASVPTPDAYFSSYLGDTCVNREGLEEDNDVCPAGHYCPQGSGAPTACEPGSFNNATMQTDASACVDCTAGYFCDHSGQFRAFKLCDEGYYCPGGDAVPTFNCTTGHYCPEGSDQPVPCSAGEYQDEIGQSSCKQCPEGFYCEVATTDPVDCPSGYYCPKGTETATDLPCDLGTYNNITRLRAANECFACLPGYHCSQEGLVTPVGLCDEGYYCAGGSDSPTPDANNSIGSYVGDTCTTRLGLSMQNDVCPAGHYCPQGSSSPQPCATGTMSAAELLASQDECANCTAGYYCDETGLVDAYKLCNASYYCPSGTATPSLLCTAGHYCPTGSKVPQICPAGQYQDEVGKASCKDCPLGYFCEAGTETPGSCPIGHYCPGGVEFSTEYPCPVGTFSNSTRLRNASECTACSGGFYCETEGLSEPTAECDPGYYCGSGSDTPTPDGTYGSYIGDTCIDRTNGSTNDVCPVGHYCPQGSSAPTRCPNGTMSSYCGTEGLSAPTGECAAGYYCGEGSSTPTPDSQDGSYTGDHCLSRDGVAVNDFCPPGHYCPTGSGAPLPCANGTFSNTTHLSAQDQCLNCTAGYYCDEVALLEAYKLCIEGYYCPAGTIYPSMECPSGKYCPEGTSSPVDCEAGTYQNEDGQAACKDCPAGYFCELGTSTPDTCPIGHYCPSGTGISTAFPCPVGTFSNSTRLRNASECSDCPPGKFCDDTGLITPVGPCAEGYYCGGGSESATPDAEYTSYLGDTCVNRTGAADNDVCPPGHFCPEDSSAPTPCPNGTMSNSTGLATAKQCDACRPGYYCDQEGTVEAVELCWEGFYCPAGTDIPSEKFCTVGHYCPEGTAVPLDCPSGSYMDEVGFSECKTCPAGFYCDGATVEPSDCPEGYYCPSGTEFGEQYACPLGTFSNLTRLTNSSECNPCLPGFYCPYTAQTQPEHECGPGHYCSTGAYIPNPNTSTMGGFCQEGYACVSGASVPLPLNDTGYPCPPGSFCPQGSAYEQGCPPGTYQPSYGQAECLTCPAGYRCPGNTTWPEECPLHFYCPNGTATGVLCPSGTYGGTGNLSAASDCRECTPGHYCVDGEVSGECAAGYFCKTGTGTPTPETAGNYSTTDYYDIYLTLHGGPCPTGHYCPNGTADPIPCKNGTVRVDNYGASEDDCTDCPAGYICYDGNPVPEACYVGYYCPYGQNALPCPVGTYSDQTGNVFEEDCLPCPAGYFCDEQAISDYRLHPCPAGGYCLNGTTDPIPCPAGSYRGALGAARLGDCATCPGGYFCGAEAATGTPIACSQGKWCPEGSTNQTTCPAGYYCSASTEDPTICPSSYYCPYGTHTPHHCYDGTYCPAGSEYPKLCPLGYRGQPSSNNSYGSAAEACEVCPAGTYGADDDRLVCETCPPGYVCLEGCKSAAPEDAEADLGYQCTPGHYCPEGSSAETDCPAGTYQVGGYNASSCKKCPANTYQYLEGQSECYSCSSSSSSDAGATTCVCDGENRVFQFSDSLC